ncbi:uncharacterized protein LOC127262499 [Andrographis paniculata]|uniref:uncharacterized protein LOC127262499 n=1 Tax=Andrographis paniculata TaxID=175694 RepID=UPI0021E99332|nr:uncharacterized protein LOC127262499 [Andrographis paniculata]
MDPCPFVRIVISNLALRLPDDSAAYSFHHYCKFKLKGFPAQISDDVAVLAGNDAVESKIQGCFTMRRAELEKLVTERSRSFSNLKIEIRRRRGKGVCGFLKGGKLVGAAVVQLDLKNVLENGTVRASVVQNGWVAVSGSDLKLHVNVRTEPDPRFVFRFDGEPECSPQIFQVNENNVRQPVFTCKFAFRNSTERILRSRSSSMEPGTSTGCFSAGAAEGEQAARERKGWSITIHDLSGSPVAAASMVTPFVPSSPGSDRVSRSNPGAWLILRPGHGTWKPWGRLEAWRERHRLGYRFDLIPDGGIDTVPLANSDVSANSGGKFSIDVTTGPTPMTSPGSSFDLSSASGSDLGSAPGSGSWAHLLYRGFVMSSTVGGDRKGSRPEVEVGAQHVSCTEDAAAFVALAAAMDMSVDACAPFSRKLRKELRQSERV